MAEAKRITSIKKSSLAGLSEEWGEECFAYVIPANYEDNLAIRALDRETMTEEEIVKFQLTMVKDHFVSGKIKVFDGSTFELVDMTTEDAVATVVIADKLYADIIGFELDPKDLRKAVEENALRTISENTTTTPSSEA